jgi:uncharacterized protein
MSYGTYLKSGELQTDGAEIASFSFDASDAAPMSALKSAAEKHLARINRLGIDATAPVPFKVSQFNILVSLADKTALLFNSRTRSLSLLTEQEARIYRTLAEGGPFTLSSVQNKVFLHTLADAGNICRMDFNELVLVKANYDAVRGDGKMLNLTIAPTMACNFACGYCYQGLDKPTKKMSIEIQDAILNFVKAKKDLASLSICWYGGEPLMAKEAIFRISDDLISYCDKKNIRYSATMVSNAFLLTAAVASQLYSRRVSQVQITIDGDRDTHDKMRPLTSGQGTFDKIMENLGAVLDATPLVINARVNVGRRNLDKANTMLDALAASDFAKRGKFAVYFSPIEASTPESGSAMEEKLERAEFNRRVLALEERARSLGLSGAVMPSGGFSGMCVAASHGGYLITGNGDVHKCWETAHDGAKRTGSILAPDALNNSVNSSLWREWTPFDNATCSSCKILPMCGGHCAQRYIYGGVDQSALPCPTWKWNTADYIFSRAKTLGVVTDDKWLPEQATVEAMQSGARHSAESLIEAQDQVLEKVGKLHNLKIDRDMLYAGEPAFETAKGGGAG